MKKESLLDSAAYLGPFSKQAVDEYAAKTDKLVNQINTIMLKRSDIKSMVGNANFEMMKDNHANHARFILSIMDNFNKDVLVETILWVFRAYRSHGFASTYWAAQLNAWITILKEELSKDTFDQVYPLYNWMQVNIPVFDALSEKALGTE
jgi:hypothetical protein